MEDEKDFEIKYINYSYGSYGKCSLGLKIWLCKFIGNFGWYGRSEVSGC